jgi:N-acetylglucosamine-6-sulfatase
MPIIYPEEVPMLHLHSLRWLSPWLFAVSSLDARSDTNLDLEKVPGTKPKNVVIILIDDLRFDSLGCTGHLFLKTPNIDRLAQEGILFRHAFVTTSLCSPSRASLLTGRFMHHHRVYDNNVPAPSGTVYFPQYLQRAGYQTAFVGKWHMGGGSDDPQPGFDRWISFKGQGHYTSPGPVWSLNIDGERLPQKGYITDELTDFALDWLEGMDPHRPFFLQVSHKAVHAPFEPAQRHLGRYAQTPVNLPTLPADWDTRPGVPMWVKNQRNSWHGIEFPYHTKLDFENYYRTYCETLLAVDDSVGRLLLWLDEHGQSENTVVFFLSDNGFLWGEHGLIDKRCSYEESIRIPLLVRGAGGPGRVIDSLVANIDIAPTVLEMAGLTPPADLDGRSLVPLLKGQPTEKPFRDALLYEYYWEWNFPQTPTQFAVRTERYKFIEYHGIWDTDELFDLQADPSEQNNLARSPEHRPIVNEMRRKLRSLLEESTGEEMPVSRKQGDGVSLRRRSGSPAAEFPETILRGR